MALDLDWKDRMAGHFGGRLDAATFTRVTVTGVNPTDPAGAPTSSSATYTCDAIALSYEDRFVDGQSVKKGDYQILILRGTTKLNGTLTDVVPRAGDAITCPPPGSSVAVAARVLSVSPVTEAFATCHVAGVGEGP